MEKNQQVELDTELQLEKVAVGNENFPLVQPEKHPEIQPEKQPELDTELQVEIQVEKQLEIGLCGRGFINYYSY